MNLKLVTLGGVKLDEAVYSVTIPTIDGEISVLPSHEPLVTVAKDGVITVRRRQEDSDNQLEYFAISGGVVKIDYSSVQILVDEADHGDDIIEAETQAALERAIKARDEADDQVEREKAKQLIDRHMVRLKVADLHRRKRRH
ncbi:ATP synthase F1 subunit epsilon [Candidatus Saccharibacteria bacterium oral taxon 488]|nr:ATP synthase F1 subunit epsilon [Candidatus Saccharibacteria bacterium oral taxon 488]